LAARWQLPEQAGRRQSGLIEQPQLFLFAILPFLLLGQIKHNVDPGYPSRTAATIDTAETLNHRIDRSQVAHEVIGVKVGPNFSRACGHQPSRMRWCDPMTIAIVRVKETVHGWVCK
jgi:hypothetical protein